MDKKHRCSWAETTAMSHYHDTEWGVPEHDSRALGEMLMLEGFQAGLAWIIVLRKREAFRKAFAGFDPVKVAKFTEKDILRLLQDEGIVRARAKIEATIKGAQIYFEMMERGEDFSEFCWSTPKARSSRAMARSLRPPRHCRSRSPGAKRRFKFCRADYRLCWMQAGHCQRSCVAVLSSPVSQLDP
jgi:DNA-3-methyladenine glycosylase I